MGDDDASLGKEIVDKALENMHNLHAASERAISQLEGQAIAAFDAADEQTTKDFMKATDIKSFEAVVASFKANVLTTVTGERSKKAVVRGRMFEKMGAVVNVVHQGMQQELASLLAQEAERSDYRVKEAEELLRKSRNAKAIEIDNAVKAALMDMEDLGNVRLSRSAALLPSRALTVPCARGSALHYWGWHSRCALPHPSISPPRALCSPLTLPSPVAGSRNAGGLLDDAAAAHGDPGAVG